MLSELVMIGFCICDAIDLLLPPTSCLSAWLMSGEYPPRMSMMMLYYVTRWLEVSLLQLPTEWPVLGCLISTVFALYFPPKGSSFQSLTHSCSHY